MLFLFHLQLEEINKKDASYYEKNIPEDLRERYENKFSSFGMSKDKRADKMPEIVEDGYYIKSILEKIKREGLSDLEQLAIMETVFNENVIVKEKEINNKIFIEVEDIQSPNQTIFNPRDTSLKLGKKSKKSWVGSKCHIVETADKGKVNFITGMLYQKANENDQKIHDSLINNNKSKGLKPAKIFADQNYISGKKIHDYIKKGQELMGRIGSDTSKKPEAFKLNKFKIDMESKSARCPLGKKSEKYKINKDGDLDIYFSKSDCTVCSNFIECVGIDNKGKLRRLRVNKYYKYIIERRAVQETEIFKNKMRVRAQVEGTISEMARKNGLRYAKYEGEAGHQLQFYFTGAALNVKRILKALTTGREIVRV